MNLNSIINEIKSAKEEYYNTGRSHLTDIEYDRLVEKAEKLGYIESVGAKPVDNIDKIEHDHPMLSLNKVHSAAEILEFSGDKPVVFMHKCDGLSISCTYEDGVLTKLETRGDGKIGNDVLFHANSFVNLPKVINKDGKYVIDGECVILYDDFEKINENLVEKYSNPRNLAAGSLNQLDPNVSKKRFLRFYAWDVIEGGGSDKDFHMNLVEARNLGFDVAYFEGGYIGIQADGFLDELLERFRTVAKEKGFPIDGVGVRYNDIRYGKSLGMTEHHPRGAIAYKYEDDKYPTKLIKVEFQVGKTGQLTPVAYFEPVLSDGKWIEKAGLHNLTIMKQLGLRIGCTCYVYLANCIIPQIDSAEDDGDEDIIIPERCPICGAPTVVRKDNNSEVLYCTNDDCSGKLLGKYKTFVSKQAFDISGLSEQTLDKFLNLGYLTNMFVSIFELGAYKKELYKLDGFGKKSIDNLLAAIEASQDISLDKFIVAFSIPGIGTAQAKAIAKECKTFDEFQKYCDDGYRFDAIDGIGDVLNKNIHKWWFNHNVQMTDVADVVRFSSEDYMNAPLGNFPLVNKTFVITGKVHHFANRDELKAKIEALGGKVAGSVSKNTDYLINNDKNSSSTKNKKAQELGVAIISEEDFLNLIGKD